ncbi:hypothetical protein ACH46L_24005 [Streptomyces althioticus]|uniref:hypothetical protein n=1 Tax=Streptomyces althioticus TaxID=83380 RepID=UPI0037B6D077
MSGRPDAGPPPDTRTAEGLPEDLAEDIPEADDARLHDARLHDEHLHGDDLHGDLHDHDGLHGDPDDDSPDERARRARWAAVGTGVVLALAGTAAALLRASGTAPVLVPFAYACGAAVCALAAVLGTRGRTRRALWAAVAGVMIMALGDQFD